MRKLVAILLVLAVTLGFSYNAGAQQLRIVSGDTAICVGTNLDFLVAGYDTARNCSITWFVDTTGNNFNSVLATLEDTTFSRISYTARTIRVRARWNSCSPNSYNGSDTVTFKVYNKANITIPQSSITICNGTARTVTATIAAGSRTYCVPTWEKFDFVTNDWDNAGTGFSKTFTNYADSGLYRISYVCSQPLCDAGRYDSIQVNILPPSQLQLSATDLTFCVGDSVFVTSTDVAPGGRTTCDTNWRYRPGTTGPWTNIALDQPRLKFTTAAQAGYYQAYYNCGTIGCDTFYSDILRVQAYNAATITIANTTDTLICGNGSVRFSADTTGGNGCAIKWEYSTSPGIWVSFGTGKDTVAFTPPAGATTAAVRAIFDCPVAAGCIDQTSNVISMQFYLPSQLKLTTTSLTFCVGDSVFVSSTDLLNGRSTCDTNWRYRPGATGPWTDTIFDQGRLRFTTAAQAGYYQAYYSCGTAACDNFLSDTLHLQVYNPATITISAITDTLLCGQGNVKFSADTTGGNNCNIKWEYSLGSSATWTSFGSGKDTVGFTPPTIALTARVRALFDCNPAPGCTDQTSNILSMQFYERSQLKLTATSLTFCIGDSVSVSATDLLNGRSTCDTNWRHRNTTTGVWDTILDRSRLTFSTLADTGYYQAFYTCGTPVCDFFRSDTLRVRAYETPAITITATTDTVVCSGGTIRFSADTSGGNNCGIQWQYSLGLSGAWTSFGTGKDTVAFSPPSTTIVARVRAIFDCTPAAGCNDQTSNEVGLQFNNIVSQVNFTKDVGDTTCTGVDITFTASPTAGGAGTCNFVYQDSTAGGAWTTVSTTASNTRILGGLNTTTWFRVIYSCGPSGCGTVVSNMLKVVVISNPSVNITADTIDICQGGGVTINSNAQNGTGCTVKWYTRTGALPWTLISGQNGTSLALSGIATDTYVKVEYECGGSNCGAARIDSVLIKTAPLPAIDLVSLSDTICLGGSYVLRSTHNSSLGACELQWQRTLQTPPTTQWVSFDTTTVDTLVIQPALDYYYRVLYTCSGTGCAAGISTQDVFVKVTSTPPFVALDSAGSRKACIGADITTHVVSKGGGLACQLEWLTSTDNATFSVVPGVSDDSLTLTNLQDTTWVRVHYVCDPNGCGDASQTIRILVNPQPSVNVSIAIPSQICPFQTPGAATATATGGFLPYTYSWDTSYTGINWVPYSTVTNSFTTNSLSFGPQADTLFLRTTLQTQGIGCIAYIDSSAIIVSPPPAVTSYVIDSILCVGGNTGAIRLNRVPGLVYALNENLPGLYDTVSVFPNLGAGISIIYVKDPVFNCLDTIRINIPESTDSFRVTLAIDDSIQCFDSNNGTLTAGHLIIPGVVYTYAWSRAPILGPRVFVPIAGATQQTIQGLNDGIYKVRVTSTAGCQGQDSVTLFEPLPLVGYIENDTVACSTSQNGQLNGEADGGTAPYGFIWNDPQQQVTDTARGLTPGLYRLKITDANGCIVNVNGNVVGLQDFRILFNDNSIGCGPTFNGVALITLVNGAPPYDYTVRNAQGVTILSINDTTLNQLSVQVGDSGMYTVIAYDSLSCLADTTGRISIPPPIIPPVLVSTPDVGGNGTGMAVAFGDYDSYLWSNGTTNDTARNLRYGTHSVTVTDENGCTYVDSIEVGLIIGIGEAPAKDGISLLPCRPNPFHDVTTIPFTLSEARQVELSITDITGREIAILADRVMEAGTYSIDFDSKGLSNGMYFCRLKAGDVVLRQKMILLR